MFPRRPSSHPQPFEDRRQPAVRRGVVVYYRFISEDDGGK